MVWVCISIQKGAFSGHGGWCNWSCRRPGWPLREALEVYNHLPSVCQSCAVTRMKGKEIKGLVCPIFLAKLSWKLIPSEGPFLCGLNNGVINLPLEQCRTANALKPYFPLLYMVFLAPINSKWGNEVGLWKISYVDVWSLPENKCAQSWRPVGRMHHMLILKTWVLE